MNYISGWDTLDWFAWMIMMIVLLATIQSGFNFGSGLLKLLLSLRSKKEEKTNRDKAIERFNLSRFSQCP